MDAQRLKLQQPDRIAAAPAPAVIDVVLEQHIEDAAILATLRGRHVAAPHVNLEHLARLDERIEAHLDGLLVAGEEGWRFCQSALGSITTGSLFVATVVALQLRGSDRLDRLFAIAEGVPEARDGFLAAFGWVSGEQLRGVAANLLAAASPFRRYVAIAACSMHRVDPGVALVRALESPDAVLRARAFRAAGELGRRDVLPNCTAGTNDLDADCRFWAAWSAVLLGGQTGSEQLIDLTLGRGPRSRLAMDLALVANDPERGYALLCDLPRDARQIRDFIWGCGLVGDVVHVPWLIDRMSLPEDARIAGEAFSMITGVDLAAEDLEADPPEKAAGPNDDPNDDDVSMEVDEDLPWPDPVLIKDWWQRHRGNFPAGRRTFMGAPVSAPSCIEVLRSGCQRQRRIASLHAGLHAPGGTLFEWRAPAWRQQRKLN